MSNEFTLIADAQSTVSATLEVMYTALEATLITKFTATNDTTVNRSYRVYIYDASPDVLRSVVPTKFVIANRGYDLAPSVVGHVVPKGGSIVIECSEASSLTFRATGKLLE